MKKLLLILVGAFTLMSFVVVSGSIKDIISSLQKGQAAAVSTHFDNYIDVKLPGKEEVKNVSKNQASLTLKNFYDENDIKGFDLVSQREMGGTGYLAGKLKGEAKTYNITVMVKTKGESTDIVSIRIN